MVKELAKQKMDDVLNTVFRRTKRTNILFKSSFQASLVEYLPLWQTLEVIPAWRE